MKRRGLAGVFWFCIGAAAGIVVFAWSTAGAPYPEPPCARGASPRRAAVVGLPWSPVSPLRRDGCEEGARGSPRK